jgi:putative oxidoreductase
VDVVELIARIVFALLFLEYGSMHLRQRQGMIAYAKSFNAPFPELSVPVSGVMMLSGGLMIATGIWPDLGALLIIAFVLPAGFVGHKYWAESDWGMRAAQKAQFWKNIAIVGGALYIFATAVNAGDDMPLTLVGPLFG